MATMSEYATFSDQTQDHNDTEKEVTVDECINIIGVGRAQLALGIMAGVAWLAESMEVWVIVLLGRFLVCEWQLTEWQLAVLTTVLFAGFGVGSVAAGRIADIIGRRTVILVLFTWSLFYGLISAVSPWFSWLLFLRAMVGIGLGSMSVVFPYVTEFLPIKHRARLLLLSQCIWALGGVIEVILAVLLVEPAGWRFWLAASSLPTAIFVLFFWTLPRNPRFALAKGNVEEARALLSEMARKNGVSLPAGRLVNDSHGKDNEADGSDWRELFSPALRRTTISVSAMWAIMVFNYYGLGLVSAVLLDNTEGACDRAGLTDKLSSASPSCSLGCSTASAAGYLSLFIVNCSDFPGTLLSILTVNWFDRRHLMTIGFAVSSAATFCLMFCWNRIGMLVFMFISRCMCSSAMAVNAVYTAEVFPTVVRAFGYGIAVAGGRLGAIITPFVAEVLMAKSMMAGMLIYTLSTLGAAAIAFSLPIETRGRPLITR